MKLLVFFCVLGTLILLYVMNAFIIKSVEQGNIIIWGIVMLSGVATGGKFLDDWQRGKNFVSELNDKKEGK